MKDTALLVIDMQNGFLNERSPLYIDGAAATVPACAEMIAFCREQNVPVFFVTRVYAADGSDVEHTRYEAWAKGGKPLSPGCAKEISADMPEAFGEDVRDYHIIKPRYSAFFATGLDLILRRLGIRHLLSHGPERLHLLQNAGDPGEQPARHGKCRRSHCFFKRDYNDYLMAKRRKAFRRAALLLSAAIWMRRQIFIAMSIARMIQRIILRQTCRLAEETIENSIVSSMR